MFCGLEEFVGGRGGEERLGVHLEDEPLKQTFPASNRGIKRGFGVFQSVCSIYIELYLSDYIELELRGVVAYHIDIYNLVRNQEY